MHGRTTIKIDIISFIIIIIIIIIIVGIESRWGARFSAPVQAGPGAHPAFYTMRTGSLSRG
jgi:hypothetical protein